MADNTTLNTGTGGDVIASDDISGVKFQRVKLIRGADGTNDGDISTANPLPVQSVNTSRTDLRFYAHLVKAGTADTETAMTLTKSSGTSATTTGTSFVITNGKRFKITLIKYYVGSTNGNSLFNFRINTGGAVTTSSTPIILATRTYTVATGTSYAVADIPLPFDGMEIVGDGTLQFGITFQATQTGTEHGCIIIGYEY